MRIEVIGDKDNLFSERIHDVGSILEGMSKINACTSFGDDGIAFTRKGLKNHKDIRDAVALVFVIYFFRLTGGTGNPGFLDQLLIRFVNANHRIQRVIRALIDIKDIFHFGYKFSARFGYAIFFDTPWLNFVFFITSQTVLSVM